ncbi:CvfB family protein [Clostridium cellulovorans]|uniref:S1 motif domain-containing protein n=1 Tax=Clostridium cellulovorans (strain ATCC 35296 / DSM 3052 / OCM 3 / 743B) TaxID=573061 RepID=D9SS39_CLOC7|nr:S1-like domain-containing RNA-binding protein [Clostridium cellulovorans]ADL52486.1 hypothetical protein Clocel_2789 [Clostridium cellulovorans 743B]
MLNLGKINKAKVVKEKDFGYYITPIGDSIEILLPKSGTLGRTLEIDEEIDVFIYRDSKDRFISTLKTPLAQVGEVAYLKVVAQTPIGAFVNIGLERDVLVPMKEQEIKIYKDSSYLFYLYVDKTGRIAATPDVNDYIDIADNLYKEGDLVTGVVYGFTSVGSALVAIDNKYKGLILKNEFFNFLKVGEKLELRVKRIYEDGTVSVTPRTKAIKDQRLELEDIILDYLKTHNGFMVYNDKSSPEDIRSIFHVSKNYFKNALGGLMKKRLISQDSEGTKLI